MPRRGDGCTRLARRTPGEARLPVGRGRRMRHDGGDDMGEKGQRDGGSRPLEAVSAELRARMASLHIMRIAEMPRIELYLDQALSIVGDELSFMALPGEDLLTGSMVNNYVKQHLVPAPERRRYTRRHVATLIYVCAFKRVFSISEVKSLYDACVSRGVDVAGTYDELASVLERTVAGRFSGDGSLARPTPRVSLLDASGAEVAPDLAELMSAGVEAVADKVFVEQTLALG